MNMACPRCTIAVGVGGQTHEHEASLLHSGDVVHRGRKEVRLARVHFREGRRERVGALLELLIPLLVGGGLMPLFEVPESLFKVCVCFVVGEAHLPQDLEKHKGISFE